MTEGLNSLPKNYHRDRAWYGSCLAKALAENGDAVAAASVEVPIAADAVLLNRHAHKELIDVAALLNQRRSRHATVLREALRDASRTTL